MLTSFLQVVHASYCCNLDVTVDCATTVYMQTLHHPVSVGGPFAQYTTMLYIYICTSYYTTGQTIMTGYLSILTGVLCLLHHSMVSPRVSCS